MSVQLIEMQIHGEVVIFVTMIRYLDRRIAQAYLGTRKNPLYRNSFHEFCVQVLK